MQEWVRNRLIACVLVWNYTFRCTFVLSFPNCRHIPQVFQQLQGDGFCSGRKQGIYGHHSGWRTPHSIPPLYGASIEAVGAANSPQERWNLVTGLHFGRIICLKMYPRSFNQAITLRKQWAISKGCTWGDSNSSFWLRRKNSNFSILSLGVVTLLKDHEVCKDGDTLTPEQARVLVSEMPSVDTPPSGGSPHLHLRSSLLGFRDLD